MGISGFGTGPGINFGLPTVGGASHIAARTRQTHPATAATTEPNPFFETWTGAFEMPPFGRIAPAHFMPAFERAFAEHDADVAAVVAQADAPTFGNTIERLERSGKLLDRVASV